jgi:hypothetical protein
VAVVIAIAARVKRLSLYAGMEVTFRERTLINAKVTITVHPLTQPFVLANGWFKLRTSLTKQRAPGLMWT